MPSRNRPRQVWGRLRLRRVELAKNGAAKNWYNNPQQRHCPRIARVAVLSGNRHPFYVAMKGFRRSRDNMRDMLVPRTARNAAPPERPESAFPTFDELYASHFGDVERWCRRLCGLDEEVEDFVHDVFMVVHRRLPEWRGEAKITTWLFAVCERIGRKRRRRQRLTRLRASFERLLIGQLPSVAPSPFEQMERRESQGRLYQALDALGDRYRTPLVLFEIEGMSGEEVAHLLGVPLQTVWVRLHRGRAKLTSLMAAAIKIESKPGEGE